MSAGDTCVQIWPVKRKEWSDMVCFESCLNVIISADCVCTVSLQAKKFLFLEPPSDSVQTESGL